MEWKNAVENWLQLTYIRRGGQRRRRGMDLIYFYCNRSGFYDGRHDSGKRRKSGKGSSKLGFYCTATMTARLFKNGSVSVETCVDHYGHSIQLAHVRIPKLERQRLAGKIRQGVPIQTLLDESQTRVPELPSDVAELLSKASSNEKETETETETATLTRLFLVDEKYMCNLSKSCGMKGIETRTVAVCG